MRSPCREPPRAAREELVDPAFPPGRFTVVEAISMRWIPTPFPRVRITAAGVAGAAVLTLMMTAALTGPCEHCRASGISDSSPAVTMIQPAATAVEPAHTMMMGPESAVPARP